MKLKSHVPAAEVSLHFSGSFCFQRKKLENRSSPVGKTLPISWKKTRLRFCPTQGSVMGGIRNSILLTKSALPPIGVPEAGSRGPAWLIAKPRCELPPPSKKRSGRGTIAD